MSGGAEYADWIAVDWGTSRLRAFAMNAGGGVMAEAENSMGMGALTPDGYEAALLNLIDGWLAPDRRTAVVICGMAGSRQGWVEAPYIETGQPLADLPANAARAPATDPRLSVTILPGVKQATDPDVMRGEETLILGLLRRTPDFDGLVCLPGTHSKWVRVADGAVRWFHTYMTGELFSVIGAHTVLRHSVGGDGWDDEAFRAQIRAVVADPAALPRSLFKLRAEHLLHGAEPAEVRARLSANLIGAEIADALSGEGRGLPIRLIASGDLRDRYALALSEFDAKFDIEEARELALDGLRAAHDLIGEAT